MKDKLSPEVSIIILNWNGLQDTIRCLESLKHTSYPNYKIVVVDNGSRGNDVAELRERFGDYIHLVENEDNHGFSEGCNIGAKYAAARFDPDYIALLNNDTVVDSEWLGELVAPFSTDSSGTLKATCSLVRELSCPEQIQYGGGGKMNIFGQCRASTTMEQETSVRSLAGASCLIECSAIGELQELFCPDFFIYYNDVDLSWRLHSLGYRLRYVPTSVVWHEEAATARSAVIRKRNAILSTRNKYLTFYRNLSLASFICILPVLLAYDVGIVIGGTVFAGDPSTIVTKAKGLVEFLRVVRDVRHVGGGRIGYLDKRLYLDRLG